MKEINSFNKEKNLKLKEEEEEVERAISCNGMLISVMSTSVIYRVSSALLWRRMKLKNHLIFGKCYRIRVL